MPYDLTVRALMRRGAPALVRLLVGAAVADVLPTEFPTAQDRRVDLLVRLADGRILHVEFQLRWRNVVTWRMLEYYALIARAYPGAEIVQVVVVLGRWRAGRIARRLATSVLSYRVAVAGTESLDPAPLLASSAPEDNVLAVLCGQTDMTERVRAILARLKGLPEQERRDAVAQLLVLSLLRGAEHLVIREAAAMAIEIDLEQSPFLKGILQRKWAEGRNTGLAEGLSEGRAEGRAEGKAEGRAEGLVDVLLAQLEKRFGPVPEAAVSRVRTADPALLWTWLDRILVAADLDAVFDPDSRH